MCSLLNSNLAALRGSGSSAKSNPPKSAAAAAAEEEKPSKKADPVKTPEPAVELEDLVSQQQDQEDGKSMTHCMRDK